MNKPTVRFVAVTIPSMRSRGRKIDWIVFDTIQSKMVTNCRGRGAEAKDIAEAMNRKER
jgi:hypothetical protein